MDDFAMFSPLTKACMGGWCAKREHCMHYRTPYRTDPAERLCFPGADGAGIDQRVVIQMPVGAWESRTKEIAS